MKSTPAIIILVSMVTTWYPVATEDLPPINEDNLDPGAAHVCQETDREPYTQRVSYKDIYTQTTNTWCWAVPPRCTQYRLASRTAYKEEVLYRDRTRYFCCEGYRSLLGNNYCVPKCDNDCYANLSQGYCVTPGKCKCNPGFKGQNCESGCASNQWGPDCSNTCQCGTHGSCDPTNGNCICHIGWTGSDCSQKCYNSFGLHCVNPCVCENGATCNNVNGKCTCMAGFFGAYCHKTCDPTTSGEEGCEQTCPCQNEGVCDGGPTGRCICKPGFKGEVCAQSCDRFHWGVNCTNRCNCNFGTCNKTDGYCYCDLGYDGESCQIKCKDGYYGSGCLTPCECQNGGKCYRDQRTKETRCDCAGTGFRGHTCSVRDCAVDKYLVPGTSDTCQDCTCEWNSTDSCHPWTGACSCEPGYKGNQCQEFCSMPFYGQDCLQVCACANGDCDPVTGECTTCKPGYIGEDCDIPCPNGFWGQNCTNICSCENRAICHAKTGYCECQPGYYGRFCTEFCPAGKFGQDCKMNCTCDTQRSTCSPQSGDCLCHPGYNGTECEETCEEGRYGYFCRQTCDCAPEGTLSCDPFSGSCNCRGGWAGRKCDILCAANNWGQHCAQTCNCNNNGICHGETGLCECFDGYQGNNCEQDNNGISVVGLQKGGEGGKAGMGTTALIVAVVIPCVVLLIIIVLIVAYYMRKVRRLKDENIRVRYEANGTLPGGTNIPNGNAGSPIGVVNPTYDDDNARNERRYPHLSHRASAAPPPLPHRQQSCDPCDDIDVEKLRVTLDSGRSRPVSNQYADIDDTEDRYTTLKSVAGATNTLGKDTGTFQFYSGKGEDRLSRSSSRSSEVSGGFTNKGYVDMEASARLNSSNPSVGAFSQPLYDNKEPSANGQGLDQPDALSSTASGDNDHASTGNLVPQASRTYDFPKSTSISSNQTSDPDFSLSQGYTNSILHLPEGQTDTNKRENPYDTPSSSVPINSGNTDNSGLLTPPHNGYLTPKNDVNVSPNDAFA